MTSSYKIPAEQKAARQGQRLVDSINANYNSLKTELEQIERLSHPDYQHIENLQKKSMKAFSKFLNLYSDYLDISPEEILTYPSLLDNIDLAILNIPEGPLRESLRSYSNSAAMMDFDLDDIRNSHRRIKALVPSSIEDYLDEVEAKHRNDIYGKLTESQEDIYKAFYSADPDEGNKLSVYHVDKKCETLGEKTKKVSTMPTVNIFAKELLNEVCNSLNELIELRDKVNSHLLLLEENVPFISNNNLSVKEYIRMQKSLTETQTFINKAGQQIGTYNALDTDPLDIALLQSQLNAVNSNLNKNFQIGIKQINEFKAKIVKGIFRTGSCNTKKLDLITASFLENKTTPVNDFTFSQEDIVNLVAQARTGTDYKPTRRSLFSRKKNSSTYKKEKPENPGCPNTSFMYKK